MGALGVRVVRVAADLGYPPGARRGAGVKDRIATGPGLGRKRERLPSEDWRS